jgi:hypothetical protein
MLRDIGKCLVWLSPFGMALQSEISNPTKTGISQHQDSTYFFYYFRKK